MAVSQVDMSKELVQRMGIEQCCGKKSRSPVAQGNEPADAPALSLGQRRWLVAAGLGAFVASAMLALEL